MTHQLLTNQQLGLNARLVSSNGQFTLWMQPDGNLVLYRGAPSVASAYWASSTAWLPAGERPSRAVMQADGHLVMYDEADVPRWGSGTWGPDFADPHLILQGDGNLAIYANGGQAVWASGRPDGRGRIPARGYVRLGTDTSPQLNVPVVTKNLGDGHWISSSVEMLPSRQVTAHTTLTCTNKILGFTGGAKLLYLGKNGERIGESPSQQWGINQAPIIGAAHREEDWFDSAPQGTHDLALVMFWAPKNRFGDILAAVEQVAHDAYQVYLFIKDFCVNYPEFCSWIEAWFASSDGGSSPQP